MARSIFDPTGGEAERSGTRFTPPDADQVSQMPQEIVKPAEAPVSGEVDFTAPPPQPTVDVKAENDGKLLLIKITGTLQKQDYAHFVPLVEQSVARHGKVRMLVELHNFHGWSAGALWEDMKFDLHHFHDIQRLAIVGETTWEKWMASFCKPFTSATIKYFTKEKEAEARAWVGEGL